MKRERKGGEDIKLDLKCCVSDAFQATSVVVSVVFYWSECCVKPANEEQLLWSLSLRAEKAALSGIESQPGRASTKQMFAINCSFDWLWLPVMVGAK